MFGHEINRKNDSQHDKLYKFIKDFEGSLLKFLDQCEDHFREFNQEREKERKKYQEVEKWKKKKEESEGEIVKKREEEKQIKKAWLEKKKIVARERKRLLKTLFKRGWNPWSLNKGKKAQRITLKKLARRRVPEASGKVIKKMEIQPLANFDILELGKITKWLDKWV